VVTVGGASREVPSQTRAWDRSIERDFESITRKVTRTGPVA
jgi:hypothetical protein